MNACYNSDVVTKCNYFFDRVYLSRFVFSSFVSFVDFVLVYLHVFFKYDYD